MKVKDNKKGFFVFWIAWTWKITEMEGAKKTKVYSLNDSA